MKKESKMKVYYPMAKKGKEAKKEKALIGSLTRTKRKEDLNVLWHFDPKEIPYDDSNAKTVTAKKIIENEEWGTNFYREKEIETWVNNYWTKKVNDKNKVKITEKTFPISFAEADILINASRISCRGCGKEEEAALTLEVTNIDDPRKVEATWKAYNIGEWNSKQPNDNNGTTDKKTTTLVFKLDPYFFPLWKENYENAKQNEFKVFKGYIKPKQPSLTFDYKYANSQYNYNQLSLVGRIISRDEDANTALKNRVIIMASVPGRYLLEPWTGDGPGSHGGGGDMP